MFVEIALKGVLTKFGIAYPKVQDVIPLVVKLFDEKNGKLPNEFVENENLIIVNNNHLKLFSEIR